MKRAFDVLLSSAGLLFLSPLFLVIAVSVRIDSTGPAFFRDERVGKNGTPFRIFPMRRRPGPRLRIVEISA
jgi:lipopolysaccharide/colanic/teichoic acid biosynthesis glycosyltransferase